LKDRQSSLLTPESAPLFRSTLGGGLRNLEREIGSVCRKVARKIAEGKRRVVRLTPENVHEYLGAQSAA